MFKNKKIETKKINTTEDAENFLGFTSIADLGKEWFDDPYLILAQLVNIAPGDNDTSLAFLIYTLLRFDKISPQELGTVGLDNEEIGTIIDTIKNNSTFEEFQTDLRVRSAIREFDKVILEIMNSNNLNLEKHEDFRKELCKFAADNSLTDLNVAFKFYASTETESYLQFRNPYSI